MRFPKRSEFVHPDLKVVPLYIILEDILLRSIPRKMRCLEATRHIDAGFSGHDGSRPKSSMIKRPVARYFFRPFSPGMIRSAGEQESKHFRRLMRGRGRDTLRWFWPQADWRFSWPSFRVRNSERIHQSGSSTQLCRNVHYHAHIGDQLSNPI